MGYLVFLNLYAQPRDTTLGLSVIQRARDANIAGNSKQQNLESSGYPDHVSFRSSVLFNSIPKNIVL